MFEILVYLGVGASAVGIYAYIRGTLRGDVKPNRVSWFLWSLAPLIATAAALSDGVRLAVLPVFLAGFGPLLIFLTSFVSRKAYWKLRRFDWINGALSLLALLLWGVTKDPNVAIIFAIASDAFAAAPTLVKIWNYPETEIRWPYITALFSALTSFGVIRSWHFSSYAFAAYLVIIDTLLILAFSRKRTRTETKETRSAGGVVINSEGLVLVVSQFGRRLSWSLPKGHVEPGEVVEVAARREIEEESGVRDLTLLGPLGEFSRFRIGPDGGEDRSERKTITMFLYRTNQRALQPRDDHNPEARWVRPEKVPDLLTMKEDQVFFRSVLPKVKATLEK